MATKRALFILSFLALGPTWAGVAHADLVGWWKLDGNVLDSSGRGHDGVIYGSPTWVPGISGQALQFAATDRVEMPGTSQADGFPAVSGEVTWILWIKVPADAIQKTVMCQGPTGGAHTSGNRSINVETSGKIMIRGNSVGALTSFSSAATVNDDQWHHIAVTIAFQPIGTPDSLKVYIDGDLNKGYATDTVDVNLHSDLANAFLVTLGKGPTTCTGTIDDVQVYDQVLSATDILSAMKASLFNGAVNPSPTDGATDVSRDTMLSWSPGKYPGTYDLYLGTTFADVNTAGRTDPKGLLASRGQAATSFDPARFPFGTTYYWRVDEVNSSPDATLFKGGVWSFTTEPAAYPVDGKTITATASSAVPGQGPENTINGSGLTNDLHTGDLTTMWLTAQGATGPAWIQYQFDRLVKLHEMWVWNHNSLLESVLGFGAKNVTIEYSVDGTSFQPLGTTHEFARAPGEVGCAHNTVVDFGDVAAKAVKLTINSNWGGVLPQYGLSEVRFFAVPETAREPSPAPGTKNVTPPTTLSWRAGRQAASHQVFLGTDPNNLSLTATVPAPSYDADLNLGRTYYWQIVEVNQAKSPASWSGAVWDFSTVSYLMIDDFESYTTAPDRLVYEIWADGFKNNTNSVVGLYPDPVNGTYCDTTVFHGGRQSMPVEYNNVKAPYYSEAVRTFDTPQNWTGHGADTLSLYFRGYPVAFTDKGGNAYAVSGGGADIGGTADQFRFVYKQLSGDGSITARVDSQTATHNAARAGVMIRETLDAGARHATLAVTPASSITLLSRVGTNGATTTATVAGGLKAPYWVRVTRTGMTLKAECSPDGKTWTQAGADLTLTLANNVYIGLAVSSHAAAQITVAEFSNVAATGAVTGQWQALAIGAAQRSNNPAPLYLVVQDKAGKNKTVIHPDPAATTTAAWTEWRIPLADLSAAGVNLTAVQKVTIGVGDRASPKPGAAGTLNFDDLGYGHPAP